MGRQRQRRAGRADDASRSTSTNCCACVDPTPLAEPVLPDGDRYDLPADGDVRWCASTAGAIHVATGHEVSASTCSGVACYLRPRRRASRRPSTTYVVVPLVRDARAV